MPFRFLSALLLVIFLSSPMYSQYNPYAPIEEWRYDFTIYGWFSTQSGEIMLGNQLLRLSPDDYLTDLSWGVNLHLEMRKKPWSIIFDINYHDERRRVIDTLTSFVRSVMAEASGAYRLFENVDGIAGLRYFSAGAEFETTTGFAGNRSESWLDPLIGARIVFPFGEGWFIGLRGDVGGFGVGADFSWNAVATIGFRIRSFSFLGGYRVVDSSYKKGSGPEQFRYDVNSHGPGLGLTFHL